MSDLTRPPTGDWPRLARLRRELDELMERPWPSVLGGRAGNPFPPVNLYEAGDAYVLTAEIPGLDPDGLDVSIEGDKVTLRGERRIEVPTGQHTSLHRRERQAGTLRRTVRLPVALDPDKAEARYRNGVLVLRIPKAEAHQPRRIAVQAS